MTTVYAKAFTFQRTPNAPTTRYVPIKLTSRYCYVQAGSRYLTRANVRNLILGKTQHALVRNDGTQQYPKQVRPIKAHVTGTRLRIGCHVFSNQSYATLRSWALA